MIFTSSSLSVVRFIFVAVDKCTNIFAVDAFITRNKSVTYNTQRVGSFFFLLAMADQNKIVDSILHDFAHRIDCIKKQGPFTESSKCREQVMDCIKLFGHRCMRGLTQAHYCRWHDLLVDLISSLQLKECFFIEIKKRLPQLQMCFFGCAVLSSAQSYLQCKCKICVHIEFTKNRPLCIFFFP